MPIDNVAIEAKYEGKRADAEKGLANAVDQALRTRTGLATADVTFATRLYEATVWGVESGQRTREYTGNGTSIDDAIAAATSKGAIDFDQNAVRLVAKDIAGTPYFVVPVVARSLHDSSVAAYLTNGLAQLRAAYGARLNATPARTTYEILNVRNHHNSDGALPRGDIPDSQVLTRAESAVSFADAATHLKKADKARTRIYQGTHEMMVYGTPEPSLTVTNGVAEARVYRSAGDLPTPPELPVPVASGTVRAEAQVPATAPSPASSGRVKAAVAAAAGAARGAVAAATRAIAPAGRAQAHAAAAAAASSSARSYDSGRGHSRGGSPAGMEPAALGSSAPLI